jgi:hypothetical protein
MTRVPAMGVHNPNISSVPAPTATDCRIVVCNSGPVRRATTHKVGRTTMPRRRRSPTGGQANFYINNCGDLRSLQPFRATGVPSPSVIYLAGSCYSEKSLPSQDPMVGVGRELRVRSFGNVLAGIHHVMVRFFVPRQTRAFVEAVFTESTSAKQVV